MADEITVYGADWCGDTRSTLRQLDSTGIDYRYIDIDGDAKGEQKVIQAGKGKRRIPLVEIASEKGTSQLSVPSESELTTALDKAGLNTKK